MSADLLYQGLLMEIMQFRGVEVNTRNSITKRVMLAHVTFDSTPLLSVRTTAWKNAIREMEWFLSGSSNINDLHPSVQAWWRPWASENGLIANNYSKQFRGFESSTRTVDQIEYMINAIKNHPFSRRNVITTWNTADMTSPETPITNCHGSLIQAFVQPDNSLHLSMHQRSSDMMLGVPHNWIQYWALLHYLAHQGGKTVGSFMWTGGDCHVYQDHYDAARRVIETSVGTVETPELAYTPTSDKFKADDFSLKGEYKPLIREKLKMIV